MPAKSTAFRRLAAIAEHHPEEVYAKNRSVLGMSHAQLHDFAATSERGLPHHKRKKKSVLERARERMRGR